MREVSGVRVSAKHRKHAGTVLAPLLGIFATRITQKTRTQVLQLREQDGLERGRGNKVDFRAQITRASLLCGGGRVTLLARLSRRLQAGLLGR